MSSLKSEFPAGTRVCVKAHSDNMPKAFWGLEGIILSPQDIASDLGKDSYMAKAVHEIPADERYVRFPARPNKQNTNYWRVSVESLMVLPPDCPQCEMGFIDESDYLCHRCRYGI